MPAAVHCAAAASQLKAESLSVSHASFLLNDVSNGPIRMRTPPLCIYGTLALVALLISVRFHGMCAGFLKTSRQQLERMIIVLDIALRGKFSVLLL